MLSAPRAHRASPHAQSQGSSPMQHTRGWCGTGERWLLNNQDCPEWHSMSFPMSRSTDLAGV